jgi:hypothetical protein
VVELEATAARFDMRMHDTVRVGAAKDIERQIAAVQPLAKAQVQGSQRLDLLGAQLTFGCDEKVDVALLRVETPERQRAVQVDADELVAQQLRQPGDEVGE